MVVLFYHHFKCWCLMYYNDVIMGAMASQITSLMIVYSPVYSGAGQRKHQSSVSLAFVRGIHRWPVNSPHKWPVTRKMFPFDAVIMIQGTNLVITLPVDAPAHNSAPPSAGRAKTIWLDMPSLETELLANFWGEAEAIIMRSGCWLTYDALACANCLGLFSTDA